MMFVFVKFSLCCKTMFLHGKLSKCSKSELYIFKNDFATNTKVKFLPKLKFWLHKNCQIGYFSFQKGPKMKIQIFLVCQNLFEIEKFGPSSWLITSRIELTHLDSSKYWMTSLKIHSFIITLVQIILIFITNFFSFLNLFFGMILVDMIPK